MVQLFSQGLEQQEMQNTGEKHGMAAKLPGDVFQRAGEGSGAWRVQLNLVLRHDRGSLATQKKLLCPGGTID